MKIFFLLIITLNIYAKVPYQLLEKNHNKAVKLWEKGKNKEAFDIFKENHSLKYAASTFYLGLYYLYGFKTVKIDYYRAFEYIDLSANNGYIDAVLQKALLYYYGMGVIENRMKSKSIINEISPYISLLNEHSKSYFLILINFKYLTVSRRSIYKKKILKKLLRSNNRLVKINLIFFYRTFSNCISRFSESSRFIKSSFIKKLMKSEIKNGNAEAEALYYEKFPNKKESFKILLSAGKQGDVNSQFNLYLFYKKKKDENNKLKWLQIAADNGDKYAKKALKRYR